MTVKQLKEAKRGLVYIAIWCFLTAGYLFDIYNWKIFIAAFGLASAWYMWQKPKQRRCKDCKWGLQCLNYEADKARVLERDPYPISYSYCKCHNKYTRKWWKFWRAK